MKTKDAKLVPDGLCDVREKVFLRLPYCQQNEEDVKKFINHLAIITKEKFQFIVLWRTSAIQSLFPIKDKVLSYLLCNLPRNLLMWRNRTKRFYPLV